MFRKSLSVLLAVILMISALTVLPVTINAKEVDFAVDGADVELAKVGFSIRTSYPGTDNYYYVPRSAANPFAVDSNGGNCTWYAWGRVYEASGEYPNLPRGNANSWYWSAGCEKGSTPRPGAVICGNAGEYGHVAFVEKVYADGVHFDYSESNWGGARFNYKEFKTTANFGGFQGFLYPFIGGGSLDFTPVYMGENFCANIIHLDSGKAVAANGDNAGDNVTLQTLDGKLLHKWEFVHQGNNEYKIVNHHSGRCLDVSAASTDSGANVQVWDSNGSDAQLWYFKAVGNGYSLVPKCAPNRSLDILDGNTSDWSNIQIWESWDGSPQIFVLNYLPFFTAQNLGEHFYANIIHLESGKAVVATGDNAGDNVVLSTLDGKLLHKWEFIRQGDWSYKIVNSHSGRCLDVSAASTDNGANVQVWNSNGSDAQLWFFKKVGNGYSLVPKCAHSRSLDILDGVIADGTNIQSWESWDGSPQIFTLNYLPSFTAQNLGEHFYANIIHSASGKAVVSTGNNKGDNVVLSTLGGNPLQKWEFIRQNDWSYRIVNNSSGKCLDVSAAASDNGANVQIWDSNNTSAQLWYIKEVGDGYSLVPKCALSRSLDLDGGNTEDGTNLKIWESWNGNPQIFYFNKQPADTPIDIGESFDAYIVHKASGYAISYVYIGGNVKVTPNEFSDEQRWHFERQEDLSYTISNHISDLDLDFYVNVEKQNDNDGANVRIDLDNNLLSQKWYVVENGSGYSLIPKNATNKTMDLAGGNTETGNIEIWGLEHGNPNQIFEINVIKPISFICGDVDGDNEVSIIDATLIQRKLVEMPVSTFNELVADVDGNGLDITDATYIQRYLAEIPTPYKIGEPIA